VRGEFAAADALLQTAIDDEETARVAADSALDAAYKAADAALQTAINGVAADLAQELLDRAAGDAALDAAYKAADSALQTAFQAADATLQANIDTEASARAAQDASLQAAFEAADTAMETAYQAADAAEASARAAADATLQANIDTLEASVNNHIALAVRRFTSVESLTASTAHTIAHGLGQQAVVIHVWDPSTGYKVVMDQVRYVDANTVEIVSPVSGNFEVVIHV
jgi:hypothetical protein